MSDPQKKPLRKKILLLAAYIAWIGIGSIAYNVSSSWFGIFLGSALILTGFRQVCGVLFQVKELRFFHFIQCLAGITEVAKGGEAAAAGVAILVFTLYEHLQSRNPRPGN